tara:strand:- start:511 stop:858 length:348 start_codon:yes stop_codon:yes gene_type:complete
MADKNENTPMPKMGEKPGVSAAVTSSGMSQEEFDTVSEIREKFKDATAVQIAILAAAKNNPAQSTEGTPPAQSTEGTPPAQAPDKKIGELPRASEGLPSVTIGAGPTVKPKSRNQ